jgi:hypothetical protein
VAKKFLPGFLTLGIVYLAVIVLNNSFFLPRAKAVCCPGEEPAQGPGGLRHRSRRRRSVRGRAPGDPERAARGEQGAQAHPGGGPAPRREHRQDHRHGRSVTI